MSHAEEKYFLVVFAEMPFFEIQFGCHHHSSLEVWVCVSQTIRWGVLSLAVLHVVVEAA